MSTEKYIRLSTSKYFNILFVSVCMGLINFFIFQSMTHAQQEPQVEAQKEGGVEVDVPKPEIIEKPTTDDPKLDRKTAFRAVKGPQAETIAGKPLLFAAYVIFLGLIAVFVARLGKINASSQSKIARLEQHLDTKEALSAEEITDATS